MQVGAVFPFPLTEIGSDPATLREYVSAAESVGYEHLSFPDHVIGVDPNRPGGWQAPYTHESPIHEPLITLSFIAAITERIELSTGILILPQRQTVLVAKQAAELDLLCGGRFILGVGTGWNAVEYEVLGKDFHNRGRRMEEQVALLRALWDEQSISFEGRWHHVIKAGINPLPPRRDIPIWMGGSHERVLDRVGRIGDGWFPLRIEVSAVESGIERIRSIAREAGRDPDAIGVQGSITTGIDVGEQVEQAKRLEAAGATHVALFTSNQGLTSAQQHIDAIRAFAEAYRKA